MSDENPAAFSLELGDDLVEMREWVHGFAESVIRPAAAEWDEREETPWPVLEEASKVGLYSLDFYAQQYLEGSGLGIPVAFEELFWGDAGIGLALAGSSLAALAVVANGTPEQVGEWCPQMFGGPGEVKLGAFCSSEPEAGSDVGAIKTRAVYDPTADAWVLNGVKTWATNGGIADVHIVVDAASFRVLDPRASPKNRAAVQMRMLGPDVLDVSRFPEILFDSESAEPGEAGGWTVRGHLTLHGQTRPLTTTVSGAHGHYKGTLALKQSDFGIAPIKVAGGAVKVKDQLTIDFDMVTQSAITTNSAARTSSSILLDRRSASR